jgi:ferredoxin
MCYTLFALPFLRRFHTLQSSKERTRTMSFSITDRCTACDACRPVCPTKAIEKAEPVYLVKQEACDDCASLVGGPRCIPVCPEAGAIIHIPHR